MSNQDFDNKEKINAWDETIRTFIFALVLAMVFRSLFFEPFHIPSGSMKDNLLIGDYLFVSKYSYGYSRYSFPLGLPIFHDRVMEMHKPERGDVVVFRLPSNPKLDFIKRVMGLPGDKIQVKEGIVYINGEPLKRREIDDFNDDERWNGVRPVPRFIETLPEGKDFEILKEKNADHDANNTPVFEVPEGHYFMMGDNRDNSRDSRFPEVGFVPAENIVGKAQLIFFSTDGNAEWLDPISWFQAMRFDRFFHMIH